MIHMRVALTQVCIPSASIPVNAVFTTAKEIMKLIGSFVCMVVCKQKNSESCRWIWMKFSVSMTFGINFESDLYRILTFTNPN